MRLITLAALLASAGACSPGEADDKPPILPRTGTYRAEDAEWTEQQFRTFNGTYFTSIYVEERSEHFGMIWGGDYDFGSGNCRVAQDYTFSCPMSEIHRGDDVRGAIYQSKMTGRILSTIRMEVENEVTWWCEGTGCPPDDEGFYGIEEALLVIQNGG